MKRRNLPAIFATAALATAACTDEEGVQSSGDPSRLSIDQFPRHETLFMTGSAWGPPSDFNTVMPGQVTGLNGLGYEYLYLFNTHEQRLEPWLADFGEWTGERVFELTLRRGVTWSDGRRLTSEDVAYTFELGRLDGIPYNAVWDWLDTVEILDDLSLRFTFKEARHQEWDNFMFTNEIVPKHIWENYSEDEILNGDLDPDPVVSGPYRIHSFDDDRIAWVRRDDWWGIAALGLEMKPRFIVDLVTPGNADTLNMLIDGRLDLANNFLPGVSDYLSGDPELTTYYDKPPFMAAANTAMLIPNTTRAPLDDPEFRRAMAFAISPGEIVDSVYSSVVSEANPTGLLPIWERYFDTEAIEQHGFVFEPSRALDILEQAGYTDEDGDGFVETLDGQPVEMKLIVPVGWTDWEQAAGSIARGLRDVGINVVEEFIDAAEVDAARGSGDFDLLINNYSRLTNSPWSHFRYLFELPVGGTQTNNFSRWESEEAWELTQELATVATDDPRYPELIAELERISLRELPAIPIWYNGAWSQASNMVWTNWPTAASDPPGVYANVWEEMWGLGAVRMLTEIERAE